MSKNYYQCLLFKQFTTVCVDLSTLWGCQRTIINVSFSSNSQPVRIYWIRFIDVKELLSMSPFQAIHNYQLHAHALSQMSKNYYQCLLFKQFTTNSSLRVDNGEMSKNYYQCLLFKQFTTARRRAFWRALMSKNYYQCLLFKQFTTCLGCISCSAMMSKNYYQCLLFKQFTTSEAYRPNIQRCQRTIINVSFSSNSQQQLDSHIRRRKL